MSKRKFTWNTTTDKHYTLYILYIYVNMHAHIHIYIICFVQNIFGIKIIVIIFTIILKKGVYTT